ncbi:hypothetical protein M5C99_19205 [Acidovorax sp. NCPPB 2350]|nr:hypothetical protein M5C99_19205 [Acidovorax sp. NCPPB 2350]
MHRTKNWRRRSFGALICLFPVLLALASLATAVLGEGLGTASEAPWLCGIALFIGLFNFSLSFVRPLWLHKVRGVHEVAGSSGAPIIGSVFAVLACTLGFGATLTSVVALIAVALDTGGAPWFLIATWRDSTLWDDRH